MSNVCANARARAYRVCHVQNNNNKPTKFCTPLTEDCRGVGGGPSVCKRVCVCHIFEVFVCIRQPTNEIDDEVRYMHDEEKEEEK